MAKKQESVSLSDETIQAIMQLKNILRRKSRSDTMAFLIESRIQELRQEWHETGTLASILHDIKWDQDAIDKFGI